MSVRILTLAALSTTLLGACVTVAPAPSAPQPLMPGQAPVSMVSDAAHTRWSPDPVLDSALPEPAQSRIKEHVGGAQVVSAKGPTPELLAEGFAQIRRSTDQCLTRFLKRNDKPPASKVNIEVLVAASGQVERMKMDRKVSRTVFGTCMKSHTDRWRFEPWKGAPVRVSRVFVLE